MVVPPIAVALIGRRTVCRVSIQTTTAIRIRFAVDEAVIRSNNERHRLYAAVDPETNEFLHFSFSD